MPHKKELGEELIFNYKKRGGFAAVGAAHVERFSSTGPPAVWEIHYAVTRVEENGDVYGVRTNFLMREFSGEDMR